MPLAAETGDMIENLVDKRLAGLEFPAQELIQPFHLGLDRPIDGIQIQRCLYSHLAGSSPKFPRKKTGTLFYPLSLSSDSIDSSGSLKLLATPSW